MSRAIHLLIFFRRVRYKREGGGVLYTRHGTDQHPPYPVPLLFLSSRPLCLVLLKIVPPVREETYDMMI